MPPCVALESTVIAHGLPHPANVETAFAMERAVAEAGAVPKTLGLIGGDVVVGLSGDQIRRLATADAVRKTSLHTLPVVTAEDRDGATTVAATMHLAHRDGIRVMATGGIGGVHRSLGSEPSRDESADLEALRTLPMTVVCSGAKAILDLPATRERLESYGVTVVGYQTDTLPAFVCPSSGLPVDVRCDTPEAVAAVVQHRRQLDLDGAVLVAVPPPDDVAIDREALEPAIEQALHDASHAGIEAAAVTPFLLDRLQTLAGDRVLAANRALLVRNARVGARIATAVAQ
jgi:pseudouridine-5'-phosphate glycosidase